MLRVILAETYRWLQHIHRLYLGTTGAHTDCETITVGIFPLWVARETATVTDRSAYFHQREQIDSR